CTLFPPFLDWHHGQWRPPPSGAALGWGRGVGALLCRKQSRKDRLPLCLPTQPLLSPSHPGPQEEEIPELEIDVDELLDMESDSTRAARVKELLVDCYKPTEAFISDLLDKIRGMQKLSTPQKK
ncbi:protein phosphatase 1 regulatory subunit 14B-like, partial [Gracilinanus agilis]|uniref:protein phosphatase 1 regulatory subunit 14B-like n=1 Tax=Gracilinanus agilis TaxID=191870 RepID=UPI001CFD6750